jgi:o-succinylbenzoate---CoA ligase
MTALHPKFKLNGNSYTRDSLTIWANDNQRSQQGNVKEIATFILNWFDTNQTISVQTSGTTGIPKKIKVKKQAMVSSAMATGEFFNLSSSKSSLCCLPVKYIAGKMMLVRAMVLGLELDIVEPHSNPLKENDKVYDFVAMVPLQVERSLPYLNQIKTLLIGGAKLNKELESRLLEKNSNAYESYSMTETVTHIALKKIGEANFKCLPDVSVTVDDRNCLVINAPKIADHQLITNDIVDLLSCNEFVWKGRIDNVINSGGIKLFPEIIEEKLMPFFRQRFFIAGIQDVTLGEKVILVIEGEPFDIQLSVFNVLEKYEIPKEHYFISKFLETETGKIKRKETLLKCYL